MAWLWLLPVLWIRFLLGWDFFEHNKPATFIYSFIASRDWFIALRHMIGRIRFIGIMFKTLLFPFIN